MPFPISCSARARLPRTPLSPAQRDQVLRHLILAFREEGAGEWVRETNGFRFTINGNQPLLASWTPFASVRRGSVALAWDAKAPTATARFILTPALVILTGMLLLAVGIVSPADTLPVTILEVAALWCALCVVTYGRDLLRLRQFFRDSVAAAAAEAMNAPVRPPEAGSIL